MRALRRASTSAEWNLTFCGDLKFYRSFVLQLHSFEVSHPTALQKALRKLRHGVRELSQQRFRPRAPHGPSDQQEMGQQAKRQQDSEIRSAHHRHNTK